MEIVGVTIGFTLIIKILLTAVCVARQFALLVIMHFTWALFVKELLTNILEFVPALMPFTCHW